MVEFIVCRLQALQREFIMEQKDITEDSITGRKAREDTFFHNKKTK